MDWCYTLSTYIACQKHKKQQTAFYPLNQWKSKLQPSHGMVRYYYHVINRYEENISQYTKLVAGTNKNFNSGRRKDNATSLHQSKA